MIHLSTMFNHFMKNLKHNDQMCFHRKGFLLDVRREVHGHHWDRLRVNEENLHYMELIEVQSE